MCGITGFARHPQGADLDIAVAIFNELMLGIGHRGRHACGMHVKGSNGLDYIFKKAAPIDVVAKSAPWNTALLGITAHATMVQGHTRHGTHGAANSANDDAAHPFREGAIVGCHNGIITNYREVGEQFDRRDLINDSQAPFIALDHVKDPVKALDLLDGYWALSWVKGGSLFFARTNDAPTAIAYVPSMLTLFWNSERSVLARVLDNAKVGEYEIWEPKSNTVYRYCPAQFGAKGTGVEKYDAPFRGRNMNRGRMTNSARPTVSSSFSTDVSLNARYGPSRANDMRDYADPRREPLRDKRSDPDYRHPGMGGPRTNSRVRPSSAQRTLESLEEKFLGLFNELAGEVEVLKEELRFARGILRTHGLLDVFEDENDDDEAPYTPDARQVELPLVDAPKCLVCERGDDAGKLFIVPKNAAHPDGGHIHQNCVFAHDATLA